MSIDIYFPFFQFLAALVTRTRLNSIAMHSLVNCHSSLVPAVIDFYVVPCRCRLVVVVAAVVAAVVEDAAVVVCVVVDVFVDAIILLLPLSSLFYS